MSVFDSTWGWVQSYSFGSDEVDQIKDWLPPPSNEADQLEEELPTPSDQFLSLLERFIGEERYSKQNPAEYDRYDSEVKKIGEVAGKLEKLISLTVLFKCIR